MTDSRAQDRRILVVEDEYYLATELERELTEAGAVVVGPVASVEGALALIGQGPALDGAVLDVNLGGEWAYPVADELMARGVPFVLATGYDERDIPARYAHAPRIGKPVGRRALADVLTRMLEPMQKTSGGDGGTQAPGSDH